MKRIFILILVFAGMFSCTGIPAADLIGKPSVEDTFADAERYVNSKDKTVNIPYYAVNKEPYVTWSFLKQKLRQLNLEDIELQQDETVIRLFIIPQVDNVQLQAFVEIRYKDEEVKVTVYVMKVLFRYMYEKIIDYRKYDLSSESTNKLFLSQLKQFKVNQFISIDLLPGFSEYGIKYSKLLSTAYLEVMEYSDSNQYTFSHYINVSENAKLFSEVNRFLGFVRFVFASYPVYKYMKIKF